MHIISRRALREFSRRHPDSKTALNAWFRILSTNRFHSLNELRQVFLSADKVGRYIVFNIGGNKYRLIASIHFNRHKVYIRHVLTHGDYSKGKWKR